MFLKDYRKQIIIVIFIYFLFYFKLFFILILFYFIKNNYLITILFSINNYFISFHTRKTNILNNYKIICSH